MNRGRGLCVFLEASVAIVRGVVPWCLLWLGLKLLFVLGWSPDDRHLSWSWWAWALTTDLGDLLPFLGFAGGVALVARSTSGGRNRRITLPFALILAAISYTLDAWVSPELRYRYRSVTVVDEGNANRFGPDTPSGIVRSLRFVEANPSDEYSLRVDTPHEAPPNVLRWRLHGPVVHATFGFFNFLAGVLTGGVTIGLRRGARRNARLAVGVLGGLAFLGCVVIASPIAAFLRDGSMQSGVVSAWVPVVVPLAQFCVLLHLARKWRYE